MSNPDAKRWNERYREGCKASFGGARPFLAENAHYLPEPGLALDAAMGLGGNAGFLIERGWQVIGVDISEEAVRIAKTTYPGLQAVVADLQNFHLPDGTFDLILNFFYLQRDLWPQYAKALRPGGLLVFETLTQEMREIKPEIDPVYLLAPGELESAFPGLSTLVYREGWHGSEAGHAKVTASIVARKPTARITHGDNKVVVIASGGADFAQ